MKPIPFLFVMSAIISFVACGQKIGASKVPVAVKESFAKQFPGVDPKWEKEGEIYEAEFTQAEHEMSASFETNGTMTESEMEIKETELPAAAMDYIKKNYAGASIKETAKINLKSGDVNYEAEIKGFDLIFDANGVFLKQEKD